MKAILVIDMPEYCEQCQVKYVTQCYGIARKKRNPKCPLKPLPQRKYYSDGEDKRYIDGYDDCIDEILGG